MKKSERLNELIEVWAYKDDVNVLNKNFILIHYKTSIKDILETNKNHDTETLSIYKLTKKGKLKLVYSKEGAQ